MHTQNNIRQIIILLVCALVFSACTLPSQSTDTKTIQSQKTTTPQPVHLHAGFRVYIDNELQDYSDFKYMSFSTCVVSEKALSKTPEEEQIEKAHMHDNVGDVVHVHRAGATWGDLIKNSTIELPENATVAAYRAETVIPNIFEQEILAHDSLVFIIGDQSDAENLRKKNVTLDHIAEIEQKSELCSTESN